LHVRKVLEQEDVYICIMKSSTISTHGWYVRDDSNKNGDVMDGTCSMKVGDNCVTLGVNGKVILK
jgi:hypothetical protein